MCKLYELRKLVEMITAFLLQKYLNYSATNYKKKGICLTDELKIYINRMRCT